MSARFVSTGSIDTQTGDAVALPSQVPAGPGAAAAASSSSSLSSIKKDEWAAVQAQLEAERQAREAKRKAAASGEAGAKSLYEVLEANKAAKQAAFEEANKIRNQFRALDEDEIGFLEEVEARKKEEAERGRREMDEGLRVFREARREERREEEAAAEEEGGEIVEGGWRVGAKRKRRKGEGEVAGLLKGVKRRVSSGVGGAEMEKDKEEDEEQEEQEEVGTGTSERDEAGATKRVEAASEPAEAKPKLGLVDYGSDDDSD